MNKSLETLATVALERRERNPERAAGISSRKKAQKAQKGRTPLWTAMTNRAAVQETKVVEVWKFTIP